MLAQRSSRLPTSRVGAFALRLKLALFRWPQRKYSQAPAKPPARPNVVVIVTDDQPAHTLRREVMPSLLDRIARNSTSFTNAIVTTPLCCPSRASLLTGQYGHNNGVLRNDYRQLNAKGNILTAWLQRVG